MAYYDRQYYRDPASRGPLGGARLWSGTSWLIVICVIVFIIDSALGGSRRAAAIAPNVWGHFSVAAGLFGGQVWRWVTYQFVHWDLFHILFNMLWLFFFGSLVEQHLGSRRFLAFYLISGLGGAALMSLLATTVPDVLVDVDRLAADGLRPIDVRLAGASGSILGVLVAAAVLAPRSRVGLFFLPVTFELRHVVWFFLALAVVALLVGGRNASGEAAHLGGAVVGFVLIKFPRLLGFADSAAALRRLSPARIRDKARRGAFNRRLERQRAEEAEVDRILEKVHRDGMHSLTKAEKRTLTEASERRRD